jgi:hypothetical protein
MENLLPNQYIIKQLAKCQFNAKYYDYKSKAEVDYNCDSKDEDILASGLCIFHDENYLQDKDNPKEHKQKVSKTLMDKVNDSIANNKALFCIGYYLLADVKIQGIFNKPVYFSRSKFQRVDFSSTKFSEADFGSAKFSGKADFSSVFIKDKVYFNYVLFEDGKKILFGIEDLSNFSFMNTDITRVRFSDRQGGEMRRTNLR